ncbi:MAG: hypothetical protein AAFO69_19595 [Bacteroidota bacterium]
MKKFKFMFLLLFFSQLANAQSFKLITGAGLPDFVHVGGAYQISPKNEIATHLGTFFIDNKTLASTLEHRLYYRKSTKFTDLNSWFFGQRITYYYEKSNEYNWHSLLITLSVGKNYYFTEDLGWSWDAGLFYEAIHKQFRNTTGEAIEDDSPPSIPPLLPSLRIQLFWRL